MVVVPGLYFTRMHFHPYSLVKVECLKFSGQRLVICEYRELPTIEKDMRFLFAKSKARISASVLHRQRDFQGEINHSRAPHTSLKTQTPPEILFFFTSDIIAFTLTILKNIRLWSITCHKCVLLYGKTSLR